VTGALGAHVVVGKPMQLVMYERTKFGKRGLVTVAPGDQELRDLFRWVRPHSKT